MNGRASAAESTGSTVRRVFRGLHQLFPFCYICKVLVGLGTPYLGHDIQTATPLWPRFRGKQVAPSAREAASTGKQPRAASTAPPITVGREIINFIG